jgi:hypothetical protein
VVTATRNRTENLLQALPSWLAHPQVREVVIVDWSSDVPVAASLAVAGISDPRLRVARVEGEAAWVLTWAFNLGFRLARHGCILKADADIRLAPGFFAANPLSPGQAITGNWRTAPPGQEYINGLFYIHRADLARVQGFNEHITRYGWDDDELYDRLTRAGVARTDLAPATVSHIDHDDAARLSPVPEALATGWTDLRARPIYGIRTNRLIATLMPDWKPDRRMQPFAVAGGVLRRSGPLPHPVPGPIRRTAERLAAREVLSWQAGPRTLELEDEAVDLLLSVRRLAGIGSLQVALMLARAPLDAVVAARLLVADLDPAALQARPEAASALKQALLQAAEASGRCLVLRSDAAPHALASGIFADLAHLPAGTDLGPAREVDLDGAARDATTPVLRLWAGLDLMRQMPPAPRPCTALPASFGPKYGSVRPRQRHNLRGHRHPRPAQPPGAALSRRAARARQPAARHRLGGGGGAGHGARSGGDLAARRPLRGAPVRPLRLCRSGAGRPPRPAGRRHRGQLYGDGGGGRQGCPPDPDPGARCLYPLGLCAQPSGQPLGGGCGVSARLAALGPGDGAGAGPHADPSPPPCGVHVRMEGGPGTVLHSYDSPENWTAESHAAIRHWRGQSHHDRFIARLRPLLDATPGRRPLSPPTPPPAMPPLPRPSARG